MESLIGDFPLSSHFINLEVISLTSATLSNGLSDASIML